MNIHLFTTVQNIVFSPLEPRPGSAQPACSTSPSLHSLSQFSFFFYRKQLHGYLCTSDLSHSSYLFFLRFTAPTAALFLQSRTARELLARLKATKQPIFKHCGAESGLKNKRKAVSLLLLIPKHFVKLSSDIHC